MRPYWKGYLKLALASCPIALHAACSTAERIAFCVIRRKPAPDSDAIRPPIPTEVGHPHSD